jgi:hypothetical protein
MKKYSIAIAIVLSAIIYTWGSRYELVIATNQPRMKINKMTGDAYFLYKGQWALVEDFDE